MSTTPWTDDHLEAALASLADHLDLPDPADPATYLDPEHGRSRLSHRAHRRMRGGGRRRLLVAAVAVALVSVALVLAAPVRHAVADWLGLGSTRIEQPGPEGPPSPTTAPQPDVGSFLAGVTPLQLADAAIRAGGSLPASVTLGVPDLVGAPPEGGVVLAWSSARTSLWIHDEPNGAAIYTKYASVGTEVERVSGLGDAALWVGGVHVFQSPHRTVASDATLMWIRGSREYRLEADRSYSDMITLARSLAGE